MRVTTVLFALRPAVFKSFKRTVAVNAASVNVANETAQLKEWHEIPGPSSYPVFGQLFHFLPGGKFSNQDTIMRDLYDSYGPIVRLDPIIGRSENMMFLYDPESCAQILRGENWSPIRPGFKSLEYYRRYHNKTKEESLRPTGLITDQSEGWRQVRTTVNPVMLQPKTIRLYSTVLDEVAIDMVARMKSQLDENGKLKGKFDVEMNLWALESIGVVALGGRLNCFDPNLAADSPARKLIQCVHDIFAIANELDFKPNLWRYFSTPLFKKAMKLYEEQQNIARYFVRKAMKDLETQTNKKSEDEKGVLEKLLQVNEETAVLMASDMLFAGVDTAANTITATFYLLAMNPDKQTKLREELTTKSAPEAKKYLSACIKEAMRILPVVAGNARLTTKEYNLLGYRVPKDVLILFNHQVMSTLESQFPRSKEYIPERWLDKEGELYHSKQAHPFTFVPFGFGVRMCIGKRIADLEIETFLSRAVKSFEIGWHGPPLPLSISRQALNYIKGPFNLTFKEI